MPDLTVSIGIGRRIGKGENLSDGRWFSFKQDVTYAASSVGTIVFAAQGHGVYDGQDETSYCVVVTDVGYDDLVTLKGKLARLAAWMEQDSIAVTSGVTEFVKGGE